MKPWYLRNLPAQEALARANKNLENARNTQDQQRALKFCKEAKSALERINVPASITDIDHIIAAYREHGRALKDLGRDNEALVSYNKADELRKKYTQAVVALPATSPMAPPATASENQSTILSSAGNAITSHNSELIPASIFATDSDVHAYDGKLPEPDKRLDDTRQLAYCLGLLLQDPSELDETLDVETRSWLQVTRENTDEKERLTAMARDVLREFTREELKDATAVAEVILLAPVLDKQDYRFLLGLFVDSLSSSVLLNTRALDGLDYVVQSAPQGSIDADDLVKILEHLNSRLDHTHSDSLDYIYRLTNVVSHVLDAMVLGGVQGLDRVNLHTPLTVYLQKLIKSADPYLAFQAAYASQALLWISNDEELWKAVLRRAGTVTTGLAGLVSAAKALDVAKFFDGLSNIQEGLEGAGEFFGLVTDAFKGVADLMESGQGLQQSLKEGFSFNRKQKWYPVLRATDTLLRDGELIKFKSLVCDAPCRRDVAFQWGVFQRLGYVAADPHWDSDTRQGAIVFLGEIYRNDAAWGENVQVKQCVLNILMQLASESGFAVQRSESLLRDLQTDGDATKQAHYQACTKERLIPRPWQVIPPLLTSSPLLDRVQKKPPVKAALREFQRRRLQEQEQRNAIYIPQQAKASRERPDDELFDLTAKVNVFLAGNQKVLLIMGDSGAGKSTFNLELERDLWESYNKDKRRIPVFITLPAIDKPDHDLIAKHLRTYDFNEEQIRELKSHHEFVLVCDGYDECQQEDNLYTSNRLNQPGEWSAQMVISCRSEYLGHDYRRRFQPGNRNDRTSGALLQEVVIAPFSKSQIRHYIEKYVDKYTSHWKVEDYLLALDRIPGLQDLLKNPFLLTLSLWVLPKMVDLGNNLSSTSVTRVALYDEFVDQWIDRGMARLHDKKLRGNDAMVFKDLCDDGFSHHAIRYLKDLAVAIFENQDGAPVVEYSPFRDKGKWQHTFFGQVDGNNLLREACPIVRIGNNNQYQFIHRSVLEYGLARAASESQLDDENERRMADPATSSKEQRSISGTLSFDGPRAEQGGSIANELVLDFTSPLCRWSFVNEPSIIRFLAERVQQDPIFERQLRSFIEQSKVDVRWNVAAANAMTILIKAGVRFNGANLRGIRIPGADLSGGQFDSVQLQGADLSDVTLRNIWLRQANLSNARMEGVEFGERPYLKEESQVWSCAYSPDGKSCVFGLYDFTTSVYDTLTWTKTHTLQGHGSAVTCAVYSPSGHQIASGSWDKTVRLWDAQTGAPGLILTGHTDYVQSVAYSPSGHQIASGSWDNTVRLWDVQTGAPGLILSGHTRKVYSVVYSPSGHQIASGSWDNTVRLWDAQTGAPGLILSGHTHYVQSVVYSPSGHQIASGSWDKTVRLWDVQTGASGSILSGHTKDVMSVAYSPSGHQIASGGDDKTVRLWDAQTGAPGPILSGHTNFVQSVVYSPSGHEIASGSDDKTVRLWDARTGAPGSISGGHTGKVLSVSYSSSCQQIASGSWDNTVRLWDAQIGAPGPILSGHTDCVRSVVYSPSGHQIASGGDDKTVRLWDAKTGAPGLILNGHTGWVMSVVYSPSGHQVASGSFDHTVRLWDTQTGADGPILSGHTSLVQSVAYSPNGHQIASGSSDKTVRLWDAQTGAPGLILSDHTDQVLSVVYSPSGHQIASGSLDKTVRLWDAQTGAPGFMLSGHTKYVQSVMYSPSGHQIASGSDDNTVRLWDVNSGQCLVVVSGFHGLISSIAWNSSPSGTYFATGCEDNSVRVWQVVEEEDHRSTVILRWSTVSDRLAVSNASFQCVQGLSTMNMQLLEQRGAICGSITPE